MLGLDRAGFWVVVDLEPDVVVSLLCRRFNQDYNHKILRNSQEVVVNHSFISKFKVHPKGNRSKLEIYFNYPKAYKETNFLPLSGDLEKIFAEEMIIKELKESLGEDSSTWFKNYFDLEITMQFKTNSIYHYSKPLLFIFRAFALKFKTSNKCVYSDYSLFFNKFINTGFVFMLDKGIKFKIYGKTIENNKKTDNKESKVHLRGELTLTTNALKSIIGTTDTDLISINLLREKVFSYFGKKLEVHNVLEELFIDDVKHLERKFKEFNPRELKAMVKDFEEYALDDKVFSYVIDKSVSKSPRQMKRYNSLVRESLREKQERGVQLTSNFKNIERLEQLLSEIFLLDIKILMKKGKEIRFILT